MSENIGIEAKSLGALQPEKHRRNSHTEKECIANRTLRTLQAEKHRRMSHAEKHLYCRALASISGSDPPVLIQNVSGHGLKMPFQLPRISWHSGSGTLQYVLSTLSQAPSRDPHSTLYLTETVPNS